MGSSRSYSASMRSTALVEQGLDGLEARAAACLLLGDLEDPPLGPVEQFRDAAGPRAGSRCRQSRCPRAIICRSTECSRTISA